MNRPVRHLPLAPLLLAMRDAGLSDSDLRRRRIFMRPARGFVTERMADRVCVALGVHGADIYGASWWDDSDDDGEVAA